MKLCIACIFTFNLSAPAAQRRSQVKWLTPVKPEKNVCPASALFHCSLIRSDAAAADHKATPPPRMKNARRAAAGGHKTTQRRRRPPVRRRTALVSGVWWKRLYFCTVQAHRAHWLTCCMRGWQLRHSVKNSYCRRVGGILGSKFAYNCCVWNYTPVVKRGVQITFS